MSLSDKLANLEVQVMKQFIPVEDDGLSLERSGAQDLVPYRVGTLGGKDVVAQAESALLIFSHFNHFSGQPVSRRAQEGEAADTKLALSRLGVRKPA